MHDLLPLRDAGFLDITPIEELEPRITPSSDAGFLD